MKKKAAELTEQLPTISESHEMAKVIPIRTETTISQLPFHRLSKSKEPMQVALTTQGTRGKVSTLWEVTGNPKYGEPGILAYKLDTLLINRLIDEMRPDIPMVLKLGSLSEIARDIGAGEKNTNKIKKALRQNALAAITAKLLYQGNDGTQRKFEFDATRYEVIFVGQKLPDGRKADAVYIAFHYSYFEMLKLARTRPLDYAYLQALPPSSQRLYELIAPQIYAALKNENPRAKYLYSELCMRAPLTRYQDWEHVKKQLYKVHQPHKTSGYISKVEFQEATDAGGVIDWVMWYTPGRKARAEFKRFNTKEGRELDRQPRPHLVKVEVLPPLPIIEPEPSQAEQSELVKRMVAELGISESVAQSLEVSNAKACFDWCEAKRQSKELSDKGGGFFVKAILEGWQLPTDYKATKARATKKASEEKTKQIEQAREAHRQKCWAEFVPFAFSQLDAIREQHQEAFSKFEESQSEQLKSFDQFGLSKERKQEASIHQAEWFFNDAYWQKFQIPFVTFWEWDAQKNPEPFQE